MKSRRAPIGIVATFCSLNLLACSDDSSLIDAPPASDDPTATTAAPETSTSTPTTGDVDPTTATSTTSTSTTTTGPDSTTTGPEPTTTGEQDDSSSGPPPGETTGEPAECRDRPAGGYQDCVNGETCDGPRPPCLVDDVDVTQFGICSLECTNDCDCFADPNNAGAASRCLPLLEGGQGVCALDCSGGESCPPGTLCEPQIGICVYAAPEQQADLLLGYFYLDDHTLMSGASTDAYFQIVNDGTEGVAYGVDVQVFISKNDVFGDADDVNAYGQVYMLDIEAGQALAYDVAITVPKEIFDGEYHVAMAIDLGEKITESDETNNFLFDPDKLIVSGNPEPGTADLAVLNASAAEHQVLQGALTDFSFDVANLTAAAVPAYSVGLYYSTDPQVTTADTLICTLSDADGIAGMAQEAKQFNCAAPELVGDHYFGAIVDPADMLNEIDEINNVAVDAAPVTITAPDIDLLISSVQGDKTMVDIGQSINLSGLASNDGADPSPAFEVAFYLSTDPTITAADKLVCTTATVMPLPAQQQESIFTGCTVPPVPGGNYWIGAIVDPNGALTETDETNNTAASAAQLLVKAPDVDLQYELHWDNVGIPPDPGDTLTWKLQIRNNGTAASPPKFDVNLHYSSDMTITLADAKACTVSLGPVPAKTITEFQFQCTVPQLVPGWYYSGIIIDPGDQVPESNEDNNVGSAVNPELIQE